MLEEQIQEQGRDPRSLKTALQLRGFLNRANKTIPFYLETLAELERPVNTVPLLFRSHTVVTIHSLRKLTNADKQPRKYRIPALKHFWLEQEQGQTKLVTACLPLHCCTFGFSIKLKLHYTHLMTTLTSELCKNDGALWCSRSRAWHWDKLCITNVPSIFLQPRSTDFHATQLQLTDAPPEVEVYFQLPTHLSANLAAIKPLRCDKCKLWFKDYLQLVAHTCFHKSNLGPHPCGSEKRIQLTAEFELRRDNEDILVCEDCMMFFFSTPCLQNHQSICRSDDHSRCKNSWKLAYGCVRPWRTLMANEANHALYLQGTPFRKLRPGCENCLRTLSPEGIWLGAAERADAHQHLLKWTKFVFYQTLRRVYQDKMISPLFRMIKSNRTLLQNQEVIDHLETF